ncbi:pyruvate ferredoxin oxidoreductase [Brenneria izadpanahii]|uniref:Pyruvate ferredoxin oxidoreductase n=1 Tax=Brenneria izadpanahii TaxID=2722756 RepID=A0ABX7UTY0_9GAMM|nr:pyruvate ferredoxin oxidoreductase [Brenneria izadpanahii]QTF09203.1 pyruvate ferredoxin oxidoreductase [Brenneria izadpanahii]
MSKPLTADPHAHERHDGERLFLSGDEAVAYGVRLCRPAVIAAYPITPQTVVVERLAEMVEEGELDAEFVHVESEHSALSLVMGSAAMGVRTFTATSSQGLLYMAECLPYSAGGRFPLVMMNANRALALPWNIYGDQSDSLSQLSSGWIQVYAETAQESLDLVIQAYALAEHPAVRTPVMINLDGFVLTHTYEPVRLPAQALVDAFLPARFFADGAPGTFSLGDPQSLAITAGPGEYTEFKYLQHQAMRGALSEIAAISRRFQSHFGRGEEGLTDGVIERYRLDDAERIIITLGSVAGTVRSAVDTLRARGEAVGLLRLRYLRPFPQAALLYALFGRHRTRTAQAIAVLEKDISFGQQGAVAVEVKAALFDYASVTGRRLPYVINQIAGLGGQEIGLEDVVRLYGELLRPPVRSAEAPDLRFLGIEPPSPGQNATGVSSDEQESSYVHID